MLLRDVKGQEQARRLLGSALADGRLAHAYLLAGPEGTGKLTSALALASAVVCGKSPTWCGSCRDCLRVARFDHPDVRVTVPRKGTTTPEEIAELTRTRAEDGVTPLRLPGRTYIGIDEVRALEARLARPAYESGWRVEILVDADRMTEQAANALLKSLEEPPDDTLFVLTTASVQRLLPTIRSRAHMVRFGRLSTDQVADILLGRTELDGEAARRVAAASDGSPGKAILLAGAEDTPLQGAGRIVRLLAGTSSQAETVALAGSLARELGRDGASEAIPALRALVHDMARTSAGAQPVYHVEEDLPAWSPPSGEAAEGVMAALAEAERRVGRYVQASLALLPPLLRLRECLEGGS
jgi:DNA polymerase-3 subunit delta'